MRPAATIALLAVVALSNLPGTTAASGKAWWPQFRGPNGSGLGEGTPPVAFGPDENVRWKTSVGPGLSSPIVWDGRIFLTEFDRANNTLATLGIDRRTGKVLWRRAVAPEQIEKVHEISSPAGAKYIDPVMNIDGKVQTMSGYQTYILRDLAVDFIQNAAQGERPPIAG